MLETSGTTNEEHVYTIIENIGDASLSDANCRGIGGRFIGEEEGETSEEDHLQTKNLIVYEVRNLSFLLLRYLFF